MQIRELGFVLRYVDEVWAKYEIQEKYAKLVSTLDQIKATSTDELKIQLQQQYKEIIDLQTSLQPNDWGYAREHLFVEFGASQHIGLGAVGRLKLSFESNAGDTQSLRTDIQRLHDELAQFKLRVDALKAQLGDLVKDESDVIPEGKAVLQLVFEDDASIETVSQLQDATKDWGFIIRGFSLLAKNDDTDAKIIRISKGSPTILEIEGYLKIIAAMGVAATSILLLIKERLEIQKLQLEVKQLKIADAVTAMDEHIEKDKQSKLKTILDEIIKKLGWSANEQPDGEILTTGKKSLELMFEFMSKGLKVDVATSSKTEDEKPGTPKSIGFRFKLTQSYQDVKQLQVAVGEKQKLLEAQHKKEVEEKLKAKEAKKAESKTKQVETSENLKPAEAPKD